MTGPLKSTSRAPIGALPREAQDWAECAIEDAVLAANSSGSDGAGYSSRANYEVIREDSITTTLRVQGTLTLLSQNLSVHLLLSPCLAFDIVNCD